MTKRTAKQVAELVEMMRRARIAQIAHDVSLLMGAKCTCRKRRDDEHEHEKPDIKEE